MISMPLLQFKSDHQILMTGAYRRDTHQPLFICISIPDITFINSHQERIRYTNRQSDKPGYSQTSEAHEEEDTSQLQIQDHGL